MKFPCVTHLLVLCGNEEGARGALSHVEGVLRELELTLHPEKTRLKNFSEGVDFLGFTVYISHKVPRKEVVRKYKEADLDPFMNYEQIQCL